MDTKKIQTPKVKKEKKIVKKELDGKEVYQNPSMKYQVRELTDGTVMLYVRRDQKLLVRLLPAIGNPKAI